MGHFWIIHKITTPTILRNIEYIYYRRLAVLRGFNGLKNTIPRAEGVAIDEQGTLYMVSEPNLFYRLEKTGQSTGQVNKQSKA